jgi:hypothetical protein
VTLHVVAEAHVVDVEAVGHDQLCPAPGGVVIGQIIGIRIGIVDESVFLSDQACRLGDGASLGAVALLPALVRVQAISNPS